MFDRKFIGESLVWSGLSPTGEQRERLKTYANVINWLHQKLEQIVATTVAFSFVAKFLQFNICKPSKQRMKSELVRRSTGRVTCKRPHSTTEPVAQCSGNNNILFDVEEVVNVPNKAGDWEEADI